MSLSLFSSASGAPLTPFSSSALYHREYSNVCLSSSSIASCFVARRWFNTPSAACGLRKLVRSFTAISGQVVLAASPCSSHCGGRKTNSTPFFWPGGSLRSFPRGIHGQTGFAIRTVHDDPSNWRVGCQTKMLSQLFARVLNRQSSLLGLIQALQKGKKL